MKAKLKAMDIGMMGTALQSVSDISRTDEIITQLLAKARAAHAHVEAWPQDRIDEVVAALGWQAFKDENALRLSQIAVAETRMGMVKDHFSRHQRRILGTLRDLDGVKTSGVVCVEAAKGIEKIAKPVGTVGAVTPATGPTAAVVAIALSTVKTRNAAIFCPNPKAKVAVWETVELLRSALESVGAPSDLLQAVAEPTRDRLSDLMSGVDLIVASGGKGAVQRAYASGTPAYGAGVGNAVVIVDETADLPNAVSKIMAGKCFDYGTSCSAESCVIVAAPLLTSFLDEIRKLGAYVCDEEQTARIRAATWPDGRTLNREVVGRSPVEIGSLAGVKVPEHTRAIALLCDTYKADDPLGGEKLSPLLSVWKYQHFDEAVDLAAKLVSVSGSGHSCAIHSTDQHRIDRLAGKMKVSRIMVNQSTGLGNTGSFDNGMPFTVILSCGTWGGSTSTENITWKHLLNYTWISRTIQRREPKPEDFFAAYLEECDVK